MPPEYPIPSSCNFVTPQDTGARNINKLYGHYFCRPQGTATEQLFIFMPGTGTNDYMSIVKTAASVGMHAVSLDWDNHPCAAAACQMQLKNRTLDAEAANCTYNLQMSRLVGSSDVPVTNVQPESIVGRSVMLLEYLAKQEPATADWAQFLLPVAVNGSRLDWGRVIIMGHSRGASYPPLVTKLFPAQRAIMTGGDGDGDEFQFLRWWQLPTIVPDSLYSMNPIFTSPLGGGPADKWFFTNLHMRGNATFTMGDLITGGRSQSAIRAALAQKFGGARAVWDAGVCNYTQSSHMCMGPCDAWQPRDAHTKLPLMAPVWKYLLTNTAPPSAAALANEAKSIGGGHNPEVCQPPYEGRLVDPIALAHQRMRADAGGETAPSDREGGARGGYPKPTIQACCCNHHCQKNCRNCLGANGSCELC